MEQLRAEIQSFKTQLDDQDVKLDRILLVLQGPDPLTKPGVGLVADVKALKAEREEREKFLKHMRALGWSGAAAGLGALVLTGVEMVKKHWSW